MTMTFRLGVRWWVLPYLRLMDHLTSQCGVRLDPEKIQARMLKGVYIEFGGKRVPLAS